MSKQEQHYRIILIGKKDAFYSDRKRFIGQEGVTSNLKPLPGRWCCCDFVFDNPSVTLAEGKSICFYEVLLKKLPLKETSDAKT